MINDLAHQCRNASRRSAQCLRVGLNTTRLLMAPGDVICAWLPFGVRRWYQIGLTRKPPDEKSFYEGKVASGSWFARGSCPLAAERAIAEGHRSRRYGSGRSLVLTAHSWWVDSGASRAEGEDVGDHRPNPPARSQHASSLSDLTGDTSPPFASRSGVPRRADVDW